MIGNEINFDAWHYLKQARAKMRLIADREVREFISGKRDILPGETIKRETLDAIEQAYRAGYRRGIADCIEESSALRNVNSELIRENSWLIATLNGKETP